MTTLEGALNSSTINGVLQVLIEKNPASTWQISDGQDEKVIYFSTGGVRLYTSSGRKISSIEDYLSRRGHIAKDQLAIALEVTQQSRHDPLIDVLERMGLLSRDKYFKVIEELIFEELADLVVWENAIFEFYEGNPPPEIFDQDHPALFGSLDVKTIAARIREWNQEWTTLKSKLYSERLRPRLTVSYKELTEGKEVPAYIRRLYSALDGQRTLREVCGAASCSFADAARALRDNFKDGTARGSLLQEKSATEPEEILEEVEKLEEALDKAINTILIHKRIATDYEKLDEKDRASEHYHAIGHLQSASGQVGKALENYRHAIALSPQNIGAHESLIRRLQDTGQEDKALDEILTLSRKLVSFGLLGRAYECLRGIAGKALARFDIRMVFADILMQLGRVPEAIKEYLGVARDKKKLGQLDGIEEIYRKILTLDPVNREARSGISVEKRRKVGRKVVWMHWLCSAAALLLGAAWMTNEIFARRAWAEAEDQVARCLSAGDASRALEIVRGLGRQHPANLLAADLPARELEVYRKAFFDIEDRLARAADHQKKSQITKAQELLEKVAGFSFTAAQSERAHAGIEGCEAVRREWQVLRKKAKELLDARLREEAFQICRKIIESFPDGAGGMEVPFQVFSEPAGAEVSINEVVWGFTPMWVTVSHGSQIKIVVRQPGYISQTIQGFEDRKSSKVQVVLPKS